MKVTSKPDKYPLGYKGSSFVDTGYFFCPYIPLIQSPIVHIGPGLADEPAPAIVPKKTRRAYRSIDDPWDVSASEVNETIY